MNKELDENLNNSYLVKRRLATLRKLPGDKCYHLKVGDFHIRLFTNADYSNPPNKELPRVTDYKNVTLEIWEDVSSYDTKRTSYWESVKGGIGKRAKVELSKDYRFADYYSECKYTKDEWDWQQGRLMPISVICDIIKYVDRIVELTAFH